MTDFVTEEHGGAVVVRPVGRLDLLAARELRALVTERVEAGSTTVVVDLGDTDLLDSSGLGALIAGLKTARQAGGDLRIARAREQAQMVLELTSMHRVLRPHASVESALDAG